jgi:transglutaminase-like putative cysteine protease
MLSADGRERIRVWGRLVSLWRSGSSDSRTRTGIVDTRALAAAGRRVGLASIVLALCAPLLIPGLHPSKLLSSGPGIGGTGGSGGGSGLPGVLSQTIDALREKHPTQVLTYVTNAPQSIQANDPQYLRQYVFDVLTDSGWVANDPSAGAAEITSIQAEPGLTNQLAARTVTTTVQADDGLEATGSQPTFLPVPFPPTAVIAPVGVWLVDPDYMVFSGGTTVIADRSYTVTSLAVDPTATQLSQAPQPAVNVSAELQLPKSYQLGTLKNLAQHITAGDSTEFAKADALAIWLASHGKYDTGAPGIRDAADLVTFLTKTRTGVCVQYAWAMTVMARLLGIPARVVSGYTAGTLKSKNHYVVTSKDDHAWPEVFFQGYGWVRFEPTPAGQGTSTSPNYMMTGPGTGPGSVGAPPVVPSSGPSAGSSPGGLPGGPKAHAISGSGTAARTATKTAPTPWAAVALAVIAAIALAAGVIGFAVPSAKRVLSSRGTEPQRRYGPTVVLVAAAAALIALSLYRLLSHTSGLSLGRGWETVGIAFGAVCVAMLVAPATIRVALRRWRWMRAGDDASRAHAAWREFRDDLTDFGLGYRPSEPPRTLADRIAAELPEPGRGAVHRLALAEERACYSARPAGSATLRRDGSAARRCLAARTRRGARWRARIFPVSLLTALADGTARVRGIRPMAARRIRGSAGLHPAVALLTTAPPVFHPLHQPGAPALARPAGAAGPLARPVAGILGPAMRRANPGQMPPPADQRPEQ